MSDVISTPEEERKYKKFIRRVMHRLRKFKLFPSTLPPTEKEHKKINKIVAEDVKENEDILNTPKH